MYKTLKLIKVFIIILYYYFFQKKKHIYKIYDKLFKIFNIKMNVHGNIDDKGPFVIISNHYNLIELIVLSQLNLKFKTVSKADLLQTEIPLKINNVKIEEYILNKTNIIPYKRGDRLDGMFVKIKILIENKINNRNILIFPEGTSRYDGIPKEFKSGIFRLCSANRLKILPIKIKFNRNVGIEKGGDLLNPSDLFDLIADVYIHPVQVNDNWEELRDNVFNLII